MSHDPDIDGIHFPVQMNRGIQGSGNGVIKNTKVYQVHILLLKMVIWVYCQLKTTISSNF